jgi:hypothetical protein
MVRRVNTALAAALLLATVSISLRGPATAQTYYPPGIAAPQTPSGARPGNIPGTGQSLPQSGQSSNISPYDTRSTIAPRLPTPAAGDDNNPRSFLVSARMALAAGRTGEAQEALERAETRILDRSTPAYRTGDPSRSPMVAQIREILQAMSVHDHGRALAMLDAAIARASVPGGPPPPPPPIPAYRPYAPYPPPPAYPYRGY